MLGSEYVIDHVIAEHNSRMRDQIYRTYTTDMLKCLAESWGATVPHRFADLLSTGPQETGDEIALRVIVTLGLKGKTNGLHEIESDTVA